MKTIDERSDAYIHENARQEGYDAEDVRTAYIDGAEAEHELLTRWHDPKEEMPEHRKQVLVKTDTENHDVAYYSDNVDGWIANDGIYDTAQIIGWREIHE